MDGDRGNLKKEYNRSKRDNQPKRDTQGKARFFNHSGPSLLRQKFSSGITVFLVIVAGLLFYFALLRVHLIADGVRHVAHVLKPILYGLAIAYILNPIVKFVESHLEPFLAKKFEHKLKNIHRIHVFSRVFGIFVSIIILLFVIVALFNMVIPELYKSIRDMIITVPSQLNIFVNKIMELNREDTTINQFINSIIQGASEHIQTWLSSDLLVQINKLMSNLTAGVINVVTEIFNFILGIIISVYVLFGKEILMSQCKKITYAVFSVPHANFALHIASKSNVIFGGFIIGKIIDSAIIGVLCFIGLSLIHMPYTLLVSVVVGVTNVIPFFGPYIGAIPSAILILLTDPRMGVYFIIFILVLQQIDGNVIGPKILGNYTGLSVFWVVFSIILGGGLFGFAGMILGVPTFALIYYIVNMILESRLRRKKLPETTEAYFGGSFVNSKGIYVPDGGDEKNKSADKDNDNKQ